MPYIDRDNLMKELSTMYKIPTSNKDFMTIGYNHAIADVVVTVHEYPLSDVVERSIYNQVKWERDTAIAQLKKAKWKTEITVDDNWHCKDGERRTDDNGLD